MMNNEKEKDAIDTSKLDEILPKYDPLKLNSINLAQNYVSAFNTGMNIYQCVNQLQGYIEWVVKAVNDVVKSWNVQVGESIDESKAIVRETTTEQFNVEWTNKQPELIEQVNTLTTNQFNEDWGALENRINTTLETQNTNIQNIQNEQNELVTNTNNNMNDQNTKINSIQTQQTNLANQQTTLSSRMDTFTSLSEGSTTGDAELQDIRVGANGTTYDTAGNAVRGQYSQLKEDKVDKPSITDDGKIPRAKEGEVEWVEIGQPTEEQTNSAVSSWLNEHPEATTTVQDHSLTIDKMVIGTLGYVTPEMFGAVGDGITDDTEAIQEAINSGKSVLMWGKTYCISRKLLLPYSFNIRGLSKSSTVIKWIGGTCDYFAKTPDYSDRDTQNVYGSISDITFECETNFMGNNTVGLYFCEPNVKLTDIIVRIGEEQQKDVNNNVIGIYLDGCTNASPSLLEKVSVHANANIGIYVCTSHTTLIDCDTAYCKNGTVIDEDTLKTDANPPYNTVFIGQHSFYDLENAILINKAKNVYVQSIFAETSGSFIRGNDSFTGELIVDGSFQISYNKVNAKNASVIFKDLQNCVEYRQYRGVNSHPCYFSSFYSFGGEWGGQNGDWIIATTDKITNVVNIIDAYTEFIGNGSGNVTVDLCTSNIPKQIGNYSDDASVNIIATKTFSASESSKLEQIHFILSNQQYANKYIFIRLRCTGYYTNSQKQLALHLYS